MHGLAMTAAALAGGRKGGSGSRGGQQPYEARPSPGRGRPSSPGPCAGSDHWCSLGGGRISERRHWQDLVPPFAALPPLPQSSFGPGRTAAAPMVGPLASPAAAPPVSHRGAPGSGHEMTSSHDPPLSNTAARCAHLHNIITSICVFVLRHVEI